MENDTANVNNLDTVHTCLDISLPESMRPEAADRAIAEDKENAPSGTVSADRKIGVRQKTETFGALLTGKKWKNGRLLRVHHLNGDPWIHRRVEDLARTWEEFANIHFEFVDDDEAEIRIRYAMDNRSWSYLGTDALSVNPKQETMHFGWLASATPDEEMRRVVLHEFGHALGMVHEHQSPDVAIKWNKPAVYRYYQATQGWDPVTVDSNLFTPYSEGETQFTRHDPKSIMHYPIPAEFTIDGVAIEWNTELSDIDKRFIAETYPKAPEDVTDALRAFAPGKAAAARVQRSFGI